MRKRKVISSISLLSLLILSSCTRVYGNTLGYSIVNFQMSSDGILSTHRSEEWLDIDTNTNEYEYVKEEREVSSDSSAMIVVWGGDAPQQLLNIEEGYEAIEPHVTSLPKSTKHSVYYTTAYLIGDMVHGIFHMYDKTVGYLSGGGNYGEEEISYSIYYTYDKNLDVFTEVCKLEDRYIVAFSGSKVIFWKDRNLYRYDISTADEKLLCKDYSYDSGIQHQSHGTVMFDMDYAVFQFMKASLHTDTYTLFLYSWNTDSITKLEEKSNQ